MATSKKPSRFANVEDDDGVAVTGDDHPMTYQEAPEIITIVRREVIATVEPDPLGEGPRPLLAAYGVVARFMEDSLKPGDTHVSLEFSYGPFLFTCQATKNPDA